MSRRKKTTTVKGQVKKEKKKKPKKLWGLEPRTFSRGSRYLVDQDYAKNLSQEEKEWLSKFNEEYYGNVVKKQDSLHLKKIENQDKRKRLYKKRKKEIMKTLYDATNARNRDIHTANYKIYDKEYLNEDASHEDTDSIFDVIRQLDYNIIEDSNIEILDFRRAIERYLKQGLTVEEARNRALLELSNEH